ncbi:hypothetical protein [uncultured Prevotellamassilia sp.]|uniref:nSTAND3 domain-containing NTPase n=1 Tax=uncultured Prevotellamassilia sp. TaxID=1926676 RepID=UPI002595CB1F|nr:hypothetical protein [uncultured Prevotellamassilia sp.]
MAELFTDQDYKNFKQLLEYFVSYLEFKEAIKSSSDNNKKVKELAKDVHYNEEDPRKRRLDDFVNKHGEEQLQRPGQGYKGGSIQEGIKDWCYYNANKIYITASPYSRNRSYLTNGSYLQWKDTLLNINIETNGKDKDKTITKLKITSNKKDLSEDNSCNSLEELGLFDGKDPNPTLKAFFDKYYSILDEHYLKLKDMLKNEIRNLLKANHNVILTGAPGTGKTYLSKQIANEFADKDESRIGFVQFLPHMTIQTLLKDYVL